MVGDPRGPVEGQTGGTDGGVHVLVPRIAHRAQDLLGGRIEVVEGGARATSDLATPLRSHPVGPAPGGDAPPVISSEELRSGLREAVGVFAGRPLVAVQLDDGPDLPVEAGRLPCVVVGIAPDGPLPDRAPDLDILLTEAGGAGAPWVTCPRSARPSSNWRWRAGPHPWPRWRWPS